MWRARLPDPGQVSLFRAARERFDLYPLSVHVNYLINLASEDPVVRAKSIEGFRGELERAALLGAEFLVLHPGNCRGRCPPDGIASFARAIAEAATGFRAGPLTVLLEQTAGSGANLGSRFEELRDIRSLAQQLTDLPIAYCLDTCHLLAAGFNIATPLGLRATMRSAGEILGFDNIRLIHANDSKAPLGSRVDRHECIGKGHIGVEGFRRILRHPKLRAKPFILETPIHRAGDDRRNLNLLKRLAAPPASPAC